MRQIKIAHKDAANATAAATKLRVAIRAAHRVSGADDALADF
jgi:hypothetical protein